VAGSHHSASPASISNSAAVPSSAIATGLKAAKNNGMASSSSLLDAIGRIGARRIAIMRASFAERSRSLVNPRFERGHVPVQSANFRLDAFETRFDAFKARFDAFKARFDALNARFKVAESTVHSIETGSHFRFERTDLGFKGTELAFERVELSLEALEALRDPDGKYVEEMQDFLLRIVVAHCCRSIRAYAEVFRCASRALQTLPSPAASGQAGGHGRLGACPVHGAWLLGRDRQPVQRNRVAFGYLRGARSSTGICFGESI
jgi:hypothetical protein